MAKTTNLAFLVQRAGYKCENPKLALTHAIASQSVEIYLEDGDSVVPVVAFVGTFASTFVVGGMVWYAGQAGLCYPLEMLAALVFGSLISATDPSSADAAPWPRVPMTIRSLARAFASLAMVSPGVPTRWCAW